MIFATMLGGHKVRVKVNDFLPTFDFQLLKDNGEPAKELVSLLTPETNDRIYEEFRIMQDAEYYHP
jgi:hypothetical protein